MRFQLASDIHLERYDKLPDLSEFLEVSSLVFCDPCLGSFLPRFF